VEIGEPLRARQRPSVTGFPWRTVAASPPDSVMMIAIAAIVGPARPDWDVSL